MSNPYNPYNAQFERNLKNISTSCKCGCNMPFVCVSEEKRQDSRIAVKLAEVEAQVLPYGQDICQRCYTKQYCYSKSGVIKKHKCFAL